MLGRNVYYLTSLFLILPTAKSFLTVSDFDILVNEVSKSKDAFNLHASDADKFGTKKRDNFSKKGTIFCTCNRKNCDAKTVGQYGNEYRNMCEVRKEQCYAKLIINTNELLLGCTIDEERYIQEACHGFSQIIDFTIGCCNNASLCNAKLFKDHRSNMFWLNGLKLILNVAVGLFLLIAIHVRYRCHHEYIIKNNSNYDISKFHHCSECHTKACLSVQIEPFKGLRDYSFVHLEKINYNNLLWFSKLTLNELDDYRRIFERLKASRINFQNPEDAIKKGTFGSVFRFANCKEELVVKYYRSENKCSQYTREEMIYLDPNLRHSFLIEYRAAIQSKTGKFIFAKYYPGGDVLEYIREHTISLKRCVGWMLNVVNGLDYLHLQRYAHRDLKLSNLFIKDNDEIVIGDFGLSIHDQKITEKVEVVGTLRYRSPDLLTQSENHINTFTDFINQDIYALGLVFSELLQRTYFDRDADGTVQEDENTAHEGVPVYKQLFFEELGAEPTLTTMREAISKKLIQPKFPDHLKGTDLGDIFEKMLLKMWEHVSLRPTSKYVKDKIKSYSERHYEF